MYQEKEIHVILQKRSKRKSKIFQKILISNQEIVRIALDFNSSLPSLDRSPIIYKNLKGIRFKLSKRNLTINKKITKQ